MHKNFSKLVLIILIGWMHKNNIRFPILLHSKKSLNPKPRLSFIIINTIIIINLLIFLFRSLLFLLFPTAIINQTVNSSQFTLTLVLIS